MPELQVAEPPATRRKSATRCPFTYRGRPTTAPNSPADAQRIKLSQWVTAILVRDGDEQPGDYQTPGANGYTLDELATAETYYAHLKEAPSRPVAEAQAEALGLLRAGVAVADLLSDLDIPQSHLSAWRQDAAFALEWEEAKVEGGGKKGRSSAVRDSAKATRITSPPTPTPMTRTLTPACDLQAQALDRLRAGLTPGEVFKELRGVNGNKLAGWRKDLAFAAQWDEAKAAGRVAGGRAVKPPKATPAPRPVAAVEPVPPVQLMARPALGIMPRKLWQEQVEQERLAALRGALIRYVENGDALPADWVEEYNELAARPALAA